MPSKNVDSARANLASTFVNGLVNAGFSKDKLLVEGAKGEWLFKNREHGRISAAASVGLICLWDPDTGSNEVDKYSYTKDEFVQAGVMLGMGVANVNVRTPFNVAYAFIADHLKDASSLVRQCSALAYGSHSTPRLPVSLPSFSFLHPPSHSPLDLPSHPIVFSSSPTASAWPTLALPPPKCVKPSPACTRT